MDEIKKLITQFIEDLDLDQNIKEPILTIINRHKDDDDMEFFVFMLALLKLLENYKVKHIKAEGFEKIKEDKKDLDEMLDNMKNSYHAAKKKPLKLRFPIKIG